MLDVSKKIYTYRRKCKQIHPSLPPSLPPDKVEFWSCDCIVKETVWNRPEKVDHLANKNLCVLQGSGIIKMIRNLAKSWQSYKHCTQKDLYGTTRTRGVKILPWIFTMLYDTFRI